MRWLPTSLRNRFLLLVLVLVTITGLPSYIYMQNLYAERLLQERASALQGLAGAVAAIVSENLGERQREIEMLAQSPLLRWGPLDGPEIVEQLERLQEAYRHHSWIGVADTDGVVRAATHNMLTGASVARRPWFIAGLEGPFVGDLHEAVLLADLLEREPDGSPIRFIDFAAPVYDDDGELRGVLASHAHWRWADAVLEVVAPLRNGFPEADIFLVNHDWEIIHPGQGGTSAVPSALRENDTSTHMTWPSGKSYVTARAAVREIHPETPLGWTIVIRQPEEKALADVRPLQKVFLIATAASIGLLIVLLWAFGRLMTRPLEKLARIARGIEQGDEHVNWDIPSSSREVNNLANAVRGMAARLISRATQLAESNASLERKVEERTAQLAGANAELRALARMDTLTGLANRLASDERFHQEFVRMMRSGEAYAVMVIDIDHFKRINDSFGHATGDLVLRHVAGVLRNTLRESDFVARVGGEEFLVLLPATSRDAGARVAEKLRAALEAAPQPEVGTVTLSIGVAAALPAHTDVEQAIHAADRALYEAKRGGRNRVVAAEQEAPTA